MSKLNLFSKTLSGCHGAPQRIVRSRDGGFVSQNCVTCGRPRLIVLAELPEVRCTRCGSLMARLNRGNYVFECSCCRYSQLVWSLVAHWSEYFRYWGLSTPEERKRHDAQRGNWFPQY